MQLTDGHVLTCLAQDCSFNCDAECCAPTIEVGDEHPMCDMYTTEPVELSKLDPRVSKCMVGDCHFNSGASCHAAGITLMHHAGHADCATFRS